MVKGYHLDRDKEGLTARERDIYVAVRRGKSWAEIGRELGMTRQRAYQIARGMKRKGVDVEATPMLRVARTFTAEDKERIRAKTGFQDRYTEAWRVILEGVEETIVPGAVNPVDFVMPEEDWLWVADLLQATPGTRTEKVNAAMDWMQSGPKGVKQ